MWLYYVLDDIQPKFLDLELKIVKHATKGWKTMHQVDLFMSVWF